MKFQYEPGRIFTVNEDGNTIAEVTFPQIQDKVVNIEHTFVDNSLRGQGIASVLMQETAKQLRSEGKTAVLTCSYAKKWFSSHHEFQDVVQKKELK